MTAGIKANVDGSGAIQVGGSDYITISSAGAVAIPQTLAVTGAATLPTIKSNASATPPTIQDSAGTQIGTFCRAWVNFNGTTVTNPASMTGVRGSFNVSSILDNGTGDYTVNFTTAMPDANYSWSAIGSDIAAIRRTFAPYTSAPTSSAFRFLVTDNAINQIDAVYNAVAIFR